MEGKLPRAYTYLLQCRDDTLYCGWTNDITARLAAHNSGTGAKYTRGRAPVRLLYCERHDSRHSAMQREAQIKKLSRAEKLALAGSLPAGEMLDIFDANQQLCGVWPRQEVHRLGLLHQVCHLIAASVIEGQCGLWLQQRAADRPLFAGFLDYTATGHIGAGDSPKAAAVREAQEEVGLVLSKQALRPIGTFYQQYERGDGGLDCELAHSFVVRYDNAPSFHLGEEVDGIYFAALTDLAIRAEDAPLYCRSLAGERVCFAPDKVVPGRDREELCRIAALLSERQ